MAFFPDAKSRLYLAVGTQTAWILLFSFGELLAFLIMFGHLVAYEIGTPLRFRSAATLSSMYSSGTTYTTRRVFWNIILRIGLYPLVSCPLGISMFVLDLQSVKPVRTEFNSRINFAHLALFSARPLIYGIIAATDPSFIRALRELHPSLKNLSDRDLGRDTQGSASCFSTILEMPTISTEAASGKLEILASLATSEDTAMSGREDQGAANEPEHTNMRDFVSHI
ncbi:hypothetical protein B0H19DRAFT_1257737 [Mycena capillaripes]|nr:hypothetical protein B0H19DRAFT_1257737 [Mycena capillaripes]